MNVSFQVVSQAEMLQARKDKEEEKQKKEQEKIERKRLREEKKKEKEAAKINGGENAQRGQKRKAKKAEAEDLEDEENELPPEHDEGDEEAEVDGSNDEEESDESESEVDENAEESEEGIRYMEDCWKGLDGNVDEGDIVGKWYAGIYYFKNGSRKLPTLYIGKCVQRLFAAETNKPIALRLNCLKKQYGTDNK